jgi:hypothetical protein
VVTGFDLTEQGLVVDNSGPPECAADVMVRWLQALGR